MNNSTTKARKIEEISPILDLIHDCWFDVNDIHYNPEHHLLTIKYEREFPEKANLKEKGLVFKKIEIPIVECYINFFQVKSAKIDDTEKVGRYDFSGIEYDKDNKKIVVVTGVPIEIMMEVSDFEVEVQVTENIIRTVSRTSVFSD